MSWFEKERKQAGMEKKVPRERKRKAKRRKIESTQKIWKEYKRKIKSLKKCENKEDEIQAGRIERKKANHVHVPNVPKIC